MLSSTITRTRFLHIQGRYLQEIKGSPAKLGLKTLSVTPEDAFDGFVGDGEETDTTKNFTCLYSRNIPEKLRNKYGLSQAVSAIFQLSPLQLVPVFGTYKVDEEKTRIIFDGITYYISRVVYVEPLFSSCIGIIIACTENEEDA